MSEAALAFGAAGDTAAAAKVEGSLAEDFKDDGHFGSAIKALNIEAADCMESKHFNAAAAVEEQIGADYGNVGALGMAVKSDTVAAAIEAKIGNYETVAEIEGQIAGIYHQRASEEKEIGDIVGNGSIVTGSDAFTEYTRDLHGDEAALALSAAFSVKAGDFALAAEDEVRLSGEFGTNTNSGKEAAALATEFESEAES